MHHHTLNTNSRLQILFAVIVIFAQGRAFAQTRITYDVTARIDVADLLIIRGSRVQWHHPGSGATVGRHSGRKDATIISSTLDGLTNMNEFAWIPVWPEEPPADIRYEALSSVFAGITPPLPSGSMAVDARVVEGRGSVSIEQFPQAANNWTLIARLADGAAGSAFLHVRISIEFVSLRLVRLDPTMLLFHWPTNAGSYQLESAVSLPALQGEWVAVTKEPVLLGQDFVVPADMTGAQRFFRLRKF